MRTLKQILQRYKPISVSVSTAYKGERYGHTDEDFFKAAKSWLIRKQNEWVTGSDTWRAFQELIDELQNTSHEEAKQNE